MVLTKFYFSRAAGQIWKFFEKFGTKGFNEVFPVLTGQGNNIEIYRMPPENNDKLRLLFRVEVGNERSILMFTKCTIYHLGNALQTFLPVVQDSNDHTLNST